MKKSFPDFPPAAGQPVHRGVRQSGKIDFRLATCMAFGAVVFVSLMAAAVVASHDMTLMPGGF